MSELLVTAALGLLCGTLLTLTDRIDEHHLIERHRTSWAYLAAIATAAGMAGSIELFPFLYPFLFGMCVEWIVKDKIDYSSHVFFLFLLTLYFGHRLDLLGLYYPYIVFFVVLRFASGTWLKRRLDGESKWFRWYYASYLEKMVCNLVLALSQMQELVFIYAVAFALSCWYVKHRFPGRTA